MKHQEKRNTTRKIRPSAVYRATVKAYVVHYCMGMSWANKALGYLRNRDYVRLLELAEEIETHSSGELTHDESSHTEYGSATAFFVASQFVALVSKYQFSREETPVFDPEAKAILDFQAAERRNRRLNIVFAAHGVRNTQRHWSVQLVRNEFIRVLGWTPSYERIYDQCDFSNGASVLTSGSTTALPFKLGGEGKISGSKEAFAHFKLALWRHAQYKELLLDARNGSTCFDRKEFDRALESLFEEADYNILCVVPKKAKSGRTIAKEPEIQNYLQKGVDNEMRHLLVSKLGLDLSDQSINQLMAFEGSVTDLDPYVTIDVKGASNSVLTEAIRSVTPPRWYKLLDQLRSHYYKIQGSDNLHRYEMFCSMGNGFCFPLETLLFAAIVKAAHKHVGAKLDFRCYGDDIICRQSVALVVIEALLAFGFRVNRDKTHIFGPFRESCGANWYDGQDVTPGYYKERVTTREGIYALHNTMVHRPEVAAVVRAFAHRPHLVPNLPRYAWVTNQACLVEGDVALAGAHVRYCRETQRLVYPVLTSVPVQIEPDEYMKGHYSGDIHLGELLVATAVMRGSTSASPYHHRKRTRVFTDLEVSRDTHTRMEKPTKHCGPHERSWYEVPARRNWLNVLPVRDAEGVMLTRY